MRERKGQRGCPGGGCGSRWRMREGGEMAEERCGLRGACGVIRGDYRR